MNMRKFLAVLIMIVCVAASAPFLFACDHCGHCDGSDHERKEPFGDDHCSCHGGGLNSCVKLSGDGDFKVAPPVSAEKSFHSAEFQFVSNLFEKSIFHPPRGRAKSR